MRMKKLGAVLALAVGLCLSTQAQGGVELSLLGQSWTGSGDTRASSGSGSLSNGVYNGSVIALVNAGSSCNSVWTFWCWGESDSSVTQLDWDLRLKLTGTPGSDARIGLDWSLAHVIGLSSMAIGYAYAIAEWAFGWQVLDADTGTWSALTSFSQRDAKAADLADYYVDTHNLAGSRDLGLLEVGDTLRLTGAFRDTAGTDLLTLGTLSANSFSMFGFHVAATFVPEPIPEPGTLLLLASGLAGLAVRRRRSS